MNEEPYERLIQGYERPVFNFVSRLVEDPSDASAVVERVFRKVFRNVGRFRDGHTSRICIYRIAVREASRRRKWFGRRRRPKAGAREGGRHRFRALHEADLPRVQIMIPDAGLIEEALSTMNPGLKVALLLREIEGLSCEEISEILEVSPYTTQSWIWRARDALRIHIAGRLNPSSALEWSAPR